MDWDYFTKFEKVNELYLPTTGEGETMATQIVTAVNKLVYKWYNDGDVYDNTYAMSGWYNDLSSYANWLYNHYDITKPILNKIEGAYQDYQYEDILVELADTMLNLEFLKNESEKKAVGSIYKETGKFRFEDYDDYDYCDDYYDEEDDDGDYDLW